MFTTILYILALIGNPNPKAVLGASNVQLASRSFSMEDRYNVPSVNQVFKDNILLTVDYMAGTVKAKNEIKWEEVEKPFHYEFVLKPGQGFAFHDQILPEYKGIIVKTTNAHFNYSDGYKSDGYLTGDGVCHLASFINWVAKDAGLESTYFASHDFAKINDVPKQYGVSIRFQPGEFSNSARQNLYVVNHFDKTVVFSFDYDGTDLAIAVTKETN